MFQLQSSREGLWPYLRGRKVLGQLLDSPPALPVDDVEVHAGHVAVVLGGRRMLTVFDAVPTSMELSDHAEDELLALLRSGDSTASTRSEEAKYLVWTAPSPIINVQVSRTHRTRLFAVLVDGTVMYWRFFNRADEYEWRLVQKLSVFDCEDGVDDQQAKKHAASHAASVCAVSFSRAHNMIAWAQTSSSSAPATLSSTARLSNRDEGFFCRSLRFENDDDDARLDALQETRLARERIRVGKVVRVSHDLAASGDTISFSRELAQSTKANGTQGQEDCASLPCFIGSEHGMWFITRLSLSFYEYATHRLHADLLSTGRIDIAGGGDSEGEGEVAAPTLSSAKQIMQCTLHPQTFELILVAIGGLVFVCASRSSAGTHPRFLCALEGVADEQVIEVKALRQFIVVLCASQKLSIHCVKDGSKVETVRLPCNAPSEYWRVWCNETAIGLWLRRSGGDIWEMACPPPQAFASYLVATKRDYVAAARVCQQWNLDEASAMYRLKHLVHAASNGEGEDRDGIGAKERSGDGAEACIELVESVQNPSLPLLLSRAFPSAQERLSEMADRFLELYDRSVDEEKAPFLNGEEARAAYEVGGPLNDSIVPFLREYQQLNGKTQELCEGVHLKQGGNEGEPGGLDRRGVVGDILAFGSYQQLPSRPDLSDLGGAAIEDLINQCPRQLLDRVLQLWGLTIPLDDTGFPPDHAVLAAPLEIMTMSTRASGRTCSCFDVACRLLFYCEPDQLCPFVDLVFRSCVEAITRQAPKRGSRLGSAAVHSMPHVLYKQATVALPPIISSDLAKGYSAMQVEAYARTIAFGGNTKRALSMLLEWDLWDACFKLLERGAAPQQMFEGFRLLLERCLSANDRERLDTLWQFCPPSFGLHDLVVALRKERTSSAASVRDPLPFVRDERAEWAVGCFRKHILNIISGDGSIDEHSHDTCDGE